MTSKYRGKRTVCDKSNESMILIIPVTTLIQPLNTKAEYIQCTVYLQHKHIKEADLVKRCCKKIKEQKDYSNDEIYFLSYQNDGASPFGCYPVSYSLYFTINEEIMKLYNKKTTWTK